MNYRREVMKMQRIRFNLINEPDDEFESCCDCIHADDSEEICVLRKCVHAVKYLYECYERRTEC